MNIFTHAQNLNEGGSMLRHGRAWLHVERIAFGVEWVTLWPSWVGVKVARGSYSGDGRGYDFDVGLGVVTLYFHLTGIGAFHSWGRTTGAVISWDGGDVSARLEWDHDDSCWPPEHGKEWSVNLTNMLLGRRQYHEGAVTLAGEYSLDMPEGRYRCKVQLREDSWSRPRWRTLRIKRAIVDVLTEGGVPVPGKGENSWDCDDDATFGMTCPAATVDEALSRLRESVLRTRARRAGPVWKPVDGWRVA